MTTHRATTEYRIVAEHKVGGRWWYSIAAYTEALAIEEARTRHLEEFGVHADTARVVRTRIIRDREPDGVFEGEAQR